MAPTSPSLEDLQSATVHLVGLSISDLDLVTDHKGPALCQNLNFRLHAIESSLSIRPTPITLDLQARATFGSYFQLRHLPSVRLGSGDSLYAMVPLDRTDTIWGSGRVASVLVDDPTWKRFFKQIDTDDSMGKQGQINVPLICIPNEADDSTVQTPATTNSSTVGPDSLMDWSLHDPKQMTNYPSKEIRAPPSLPKDIIGRTQVTMHFSSTQGQDDEVPTIECISTSDPLDTPAVTQGTAPAPPANRLSTFRDDELDTYDFLWEYLPGRKFRLTNCYNEWNHVISDWKAMEFRKPPRRRRPATGSNQERTQLYNFQITESFAKAIDDSIKERQGQGVGSVTGVMEVKERASGKPNYPT